jgi:hypothetical protein
MASIGWLGAGESLNRLPPQRGGLRPRLQTQCRTGGISNECGTERSVPRSFAAFLYCRLAVGTIVTVLHRVSRVEFAQSKNEFEKLSERVRVLEAAEQRRFVMELNSRSKYTTNGSGRLEAERETPVLANPRATQSASDKPSH